MSLSENQLNFQNYNNKHTGASMRTRRALFRPLFYFCIVLHKILRQTRKKIIQQLMKQILHINREKLLTLKVCLI
jgi:hypothetical protein